MKMPLKILSALLILLLPASGWALSAKDRLLIKKNFYFLYLVEEGRLKLTGVPFETVQQRLKEEARDLNCSRASCFSERLRFTEEEIVAVGNELVRLCIDGSRVKALVNGLRSSGAYHLYSPAPDTGFIRKVWEADAAGINFILKTYIGGQAPLYPKIDAISFHDTDSRFVSALRGRVRQILKEGDVFYKLPMLLAVEALRLNGRDEAVRYEPLRNGSNAASYKRVKRIDWKKYRYSAILVPGLGPEDPGVKLHPDGAKRCDSAVIRYRRGEAPFLVVSGGHVHPNKTPICEAAEMKKYMVEVLDVPQNAVIIEPHARHTTTNLRNISRIVYRFNMPADKPILIVTDASQNEYINGNMGNKVLKELGYKPYVSIRKLNAFETAFLPSENSMQINSLDPLDP